MTDTRARLRRAIETRLPADLPGFLPGRRWFGAKARSLAAVEVEDGIALSEPGAPAEAGDALLVTRLTYADGASDRYALIAGVREAPGDLPVIARLEDGAWLVESAADPRAARALLAVLDEAAPRPTWRAGRVSGGDAFPGPAGVFSPARLPLGGFRALRAEQSNTSIRCGESQVFKLFRRLEPGENPELEIGRFLMARTAFRSMPALRGSITHESAGGSRATIGVVQDWIENQGDGWHHVTRVLAEALAAAGRDPEARPELRALEDEMRGLGATTAGFHHAVASDPAEPAFAPEPATAADRAVWASDLEARARRAAASLAAGTSRLDPGTRTLAEAFLRRRQLLPAAPPDPDFARIRVHGDYHLGQTLRTESGYVLVDFEGEPTRPLEERRTKHCALKDVAGMLRSFDYAAQTAGGAVETAARERAAAVLREAFLDGYRRQARAGEASFLPQDRAGFDAWTAFFELDKAVYEIEYELNHRPEWVAIPLRGILRIVARAA